MLHNRRQIQINERAPINWLSLSLSLFVHLELQQAAWILQRGLVHVNRKFVAFICIFFVYARAHLVRIIIMHIELKEQVEGPIN